MKIISNDKLIKKNLKITKYVTWASMIVLGIGIYLSLSELSASEPESTKTLALTFGALLVGFTLSQISIYMQNRWGRSPRPDELIISNLKGLDDRYTLYIYSSPIPHLLVSSAGVWGLIAYPQEGTITFTNNKWKHKGGNTLRKIFAGDSIGKPELDHDNLVSDYSRAFKKANPELVLPPLNVALVFTNPKIEITAEEAPIPTIPIKKLKETIRKHAKLEAIPQATVDQINQILRN